MADSISQRKPTQIGTRIDLTPMPLHLPVNFVLVLSLVPSRLLLHLAFVARHPPALDLSRETLPKAHFRTPLLVWNICQDRVPVLILLANPLYLVFRMFSDLHLPFLRNPVARPVRLLTRQFAGMVIALFSRMLTVACE
jgi:hypothetical protein